MSRIPWLMTITSAVGLLGLTQAGCNQIDCGDGTVERNGACEPADTTTSDAKCGDGTHLEQDICVPDDQTICDPATTMAVEDPVTHVTTCVGTGQGGGCGSPLACGAASGGKINVCGQLIDAETDEPIAASGATGAMCDIDHPAASGPCSMILNFYDAIQFVSSTSPAKLTASGPVYIDDCGRFRITGLANPGSGFLGVEIDDNEPKGASDVHTRSGVALATAANKSFTVEAYAVEKTTDTAWTTSAGLTGMTFAQRGTWLGIYRYKGAAESGVTVTRNGAPVPAADDFFFTDNSATARTTPVASAAAATTGKNGSVLLLNSTLVAHSGTGGDGLPGTCKWASALGAGIMNAYVVQIRDAVLTTDANTLCP